MTKQDSLLHQIRQSYFGIFTFPSFKEFQKLAPLPHKVRVSEALARLIQLGPPMISSA